MVFATGLSKSFQTVILCTVALISPFLCWTPPPPPFALFLPHKTSLCALTCISYSRTQRSLLCPPQLSHSKRNTEVSLSGKWIKLVQRHNFPHSFPGQEGMTSLQADLVYVKWIENWAIYSTDGVSAFWPQGRNVDVFQYEHYLVTSLLLSSYVSFIYLVSVKL